jgi:hypothetical protein
MARFYLRQLINKRAANCKELYQASLSPGHARETSRRSNETKRRAFRPVLEALEERQTPSVTFADQQTFATGALFSAPYAMATADFNNDGKPDLVVTNFATKSVTILLNTTAVGSATITYAAPQTFAVGNSPSSVAVADFNGDGKPDLVVTNATDQSVSVLLNTTATGSATVTFTGQQTFAVGNSPQGVVVGDFNGDNKADIAVTNNQDNTASVFLNTTATASAIASFTGQQTFAVGTGPWGLTTADFNGDGKPDLAVANFNNGGGNTVSVLLDTTAVGAVAPSFTTQQTFAVGNGPYGIAATDFNGDNKPDLVTTNASDGTVSVLLDTTATGAGSATFTAQKTFAAGPVPVAVVTADLDGNGRPDLAVVNNNNSGSSWLSVLLNNTLAGASSPTFVSQQTFAVGFGPQSVATADMNQDGVPDLAVTNSASAGNSASVLLNLTPRANPQAVIAGKGAGKAITLTGNVPNGDAFTYKIATNPAHGSLSGFNSTTGAVTYTSSGNFTGADSFTFEVTDSVTGLTSVASTVSLTVLPPPTANSLNVTVGKGQATTLTLTGSAPNGDAFSFSVSTNPANGSVSGFLSGGQIIYTPNAGFTGADSFQFKVTDIVTTLTSTATVTITVSVPPTANAQSVSVGESLAKSITLTGSAPGSHPFSYAVTSNPSHGLLSNLNANTGAITYTPIGVYLGPDSFQFTVTDNTTSLTSTATVSLTVLPPPTANAQSLTTGVSQAKAITLTGSAPNGDAFTFAVTGNPSHGTVTVLNVATGQVTYTPTAGYLGPDSFQFTITDSVTTLTNNATISVTMLPPPVANPQSVTQMQAKSTNLTLTGTAPSGDALLFEVTANPSHGTLSGLNATTGTVTYTPTGNYAGTDSFSFKVTDTTDGLVSVPAAVSLTIQPLTVVGQYGNQGVWQFNPAAGVWTQLTAANATILTSDPLGDVFAEFPHYGVWMYQPSAGWQQLTTSDASVLSADAQGNLNGEFHGAGVWQFQPGTGWQHLNTVDATLLAAGPSGVLVAEYAGAGVWQYTPGSGWQQLTTSDAALLAAGASGKVVGEFIGAGVWQYTPGSGWRQLTGSNASALTADPQGNVAAVFANAGVWRYTTATGWRQLTTANAAALSTDSLGDIFAQFNGAGLWEFDPARGWLQLNPVDTTLLTTA